MRPCSSRQLAAALVRLGCYYEKSGSGSHRTFRRQLPDGTILRAPIVLGKGEVKRGTARSILRLLQFPKPILTGLCAELKAEPALRSSSKAG